MRPSSSFYSGPTSSSLSTSATSRFLNNMLKVNKLSSSAVFTIDCTSITKMKLFWVPHLMLTNLSPHSSSVYCLLIALHKLLHSFIIDNMLSFITFIIYLFYSNQLPVAPHLYHLQSLYASFSYIQGFDIK